MALSQYFVEIRLIQENFRCQGPDEKYIVNKAKIIPECVYTFLSC